MTVRPLDLAEPEHRAPALSAPAANDVRSTPAQKRQTWTEQAQYLRSQVWVLWLILKDGRTPWYAKTIAACAAGYVFSPIQLIPSFIPVIGFLDDFLVLSIGLRLMHCLVPEAVIRECRDRARQQRHQVAHTPARWAGAIVIAALWLILMAAGTVLLYQP